MIYKVLGDLTTVAIRVRPSWEMLTKLGDVLTKLGAVLIKFGDVLTELGDVTINWKMH